MSLNPIDWGRVPQAALVLLVVVRLPALASIETTAGLAGGLVGATLAATLVVGGVRWLAIRVSGLRGGDAEQAAT